MHSSYDDEIISLFKAGLTDKQIAQQLQDSNQGHRGLSERSIQRKLNELGLQRRSKLTDNCVDGIMSDAVSKIGCASGRRFVKGHLRSIGAPLIGEKRIDSSLKRIDPHNHVMRRNFVLQCTNPQPYVASYFGQNLHVDQNEKLVMFGVVHVAAIDGYCGYVTAATTMPIKNNLTIYEEVYCVTCSKFGLFDRLVVDLGKEFALMLAVQESLRDYRHDQRKSSFKQVMSIKNNRIERFWVEVNQRINYPLKEILISMEQAGRFDQNDHYQMFALSQASCSVAAAGLRIFVAARNHQTVAGRGRPSALMKKSNAVDLPAGVLPSVDAAAASYRSNGGNLTDLHVFGIDPLDGNDDKIARRDELIMAYGYSCTDLYGYVSNNQRNQFEDYVMYCIDINRSLM